jgi:hypothetical protein
LTSEWSEVWMITQSLPENQDLPDPVIEMVDTLIWHSAGGAEPTVQQARAWMQQIMQVSNQDGPVVRKALKSCREFLQKKGSLIEDTFRD